MTTVGQYFFQTILSAIVGFVAGLAAVWAQQRFAWVPQKRMELRRQAFDEARTALAMYEVDAIDVVLQSSKPISGAIPHIMLRTETKVQMQKAFLVVEAFFPKQTFEAFSEALKCDIGPHNIPQREFAKKSAKALKLMATDTGLNPDD